MVEAGDLDAADVVVIEGAADRGPGTWLREWQHGAGHEGVHDRWAGVVGTARGITRQHGGAAGGRWPHLQTRRSPDSLPQAAPCSPLLPSQCWLTRWE